MLGQHYGMVRFMVGTVSQGSVLCRINAFICLNRSARWRHCLRIDAIGYAWLVNTSPLWAWQMGWAGIQTNSFILISKLTLTKTYNSQF